MVQFLGSSRMRILRFAGCNYGLRHKKPSTQARPAILVSFTNRFGIPFFSQYVNTHILSIFEVMGYPVWASLIILLENSLSCCDESTVFLPNLDLLCLFSAKYALRVLLGTIQWMAAALVNSLLVLIDPIAFCKSSSWQLPLTFFLLYFPIV